MCLNLGKYLLITQDLLLAERLLLLAVCSSAFFVDSETLPRNRRDRYEASGPWYLCS